MATAKKITTSFNVTFTSPDSAGILIAEVDGRDPADGGLNSKTSFVPGDSVIFLIYQGEHVTLDEIIHSWGSSSLFQSGVSVNQEETLTFTSPDSLSQTLKYPVDSIQSYQWLGNSTLGNPKIDGNTITCAIAGGSKYGIGVLRVNYTAKGNAYKLTHAPLGYATYDIATLVVGTYTPPMG